MATTTTPDHDRRTAAEAQIAQQLAEAHAMEVALATTLRTHIAMTPPGGYRELLERHLGETRRQADALEAHLAEVDAARGLVPAVLDLAQTIAGQVLVLAKGPVDLLRGRSHAEKLLKNAKDECATEALEIATYDSIRALADSIGDAETAELALRHRGEEERMLEELRALLPSLTDAVLDEQVAAAA
jgi:ferritin-like metal-binding protein YciE